MTIRFFFLLMFLTKLICPVHLLHDGNGISGKRCWILHIVINDAVKDFFFIFTRKRRLAGRQSNADSAFMLPVIELLKFIFKMFVKNVWAQIFHQPLQLASRKWGRPSPTSPQRGCRCRQSEPLGQETLESHRRSRSDLHGPSLEQYHFDLLPIQK